MRSGSLTANLSDSNPWASSRDGISPKIPALQEVTHGGLRGGAGDPSSSQGQLDTGFDKIIIIIIKKILEESKFVSK